MGVYTELLVHVPHATDDEVVAIERPLPDFGDRNDQRLTLIPDSYVWHSYVRSLVWESFAESFAAIAFASPKTVEVMVRNEWDDLFSVWRLEAVSRAPARYRLVEVLSASHSIDLRHVPRTSAS